MRGLMAKQLRVASKQLAEQNGGDVKRIYKLLKNRYTHCRKDWTS